MPVAESQAGHEPRLEEILTLDEAAAYLRVEAEAVEALVDRQGIPARKIGGEWRFSRKALEDWMRFPDLQHQDYWILRFPFAEDLLLLLEERLLKKLRQIESPPQRPGSKDAVLRHFGVFKDDDDLEERLAEARRRRESEG